MMGANDLIDSHEYISKVILKNFAFKDGNIKYVNFLEFPNGKPHCGNIKKFNVRYGAYSKEGEDALNNGFEDYFGKKIDHINKCLRHEGILNADDFDVSRIKKYFAFQCLRDDVFISRIITTDGAICNNELKGLIKSGDISLPDLKNYLIENEGEQEIFEKVFEEDALIVGIDVSGCLMGSSFVVDLGGADKYNNLGLALSPKVVFMLTKDFDKELTLKYNKFAWKQLDEKEVAFFNKRIFECGWHRCGGIAISKNRKQLEVAYRSRLFRG